jgi:hypothetical protein
MPGISYVYGIGTEQALKETICNVEAAIWKSL